MVESCRQGELSRPKSGRARTVPTVEQVDEALTKLAGRERQTQPADLVFPGSEGGYMDSSALRRGYVAALKRADLRALRLQTCATASARWRSTTARSSRSRAWMGRADVNTTVRYPHHKSRADDARLLSPAFRANGDAADGGPRSAA